MWREKYVNTQRYCKTLVEVHGAWCTENDAHTLLPRIDKMTVNRKHCGHHFLYTRYHMHLLQSFHITECFLLMYECLITYTCHLVIAYMV